MEAANLISEKDISDVLTADYHAGSERSARFSELDGYYVIWSGGAFPHSQWFLNFNYARLFKNDPRFKGLISADASDPDLGKFNLLPVITPLEFLRRRRKGERIGLVHFFTTPTEFAFFKGLSSLSFSFICVLHSKGLAHTYVSMESERVFILENLGRYAQIIEGFSDYTSKQMLMARLRSIMSLNMEFIIRNNYPIEFEYFNGFSNEVSFLLKDREIFCDIGASWGDCVVRFSNTVKDLDNSNIYAFEPNGKEFNTLRTMQGTLPLKANNSIVSSHTGEGYFLTDPGNVHGSHISKAGDKSDVRQTVRLDDACEKLTLIKIDAEGAEPDIIAGAQRILSDHGCRLTSCIYHYPADMFKTIDLMKEFDRKKFFFRQHHSSIWDGLIYFEE